jgi:myosin heavy subunit
MATERIETLISKEALAQFDELNSKLGISITGFEKLVAKAVETNKALGGAKTFKQVIDGTKELEKAEADLNKQRSDLEKQQAKLSALYGEEAKRIAQVKVQQTEQNKVLKDQAREALGLVDAYGKLEKEYNAAAKEAKNLAAQFGAQSKQAQEASKRALELDQRLKAADANVGRFNKNVGNYSGAMKTLEKALDDVNKNIQAQTQSGQANEQVMQALTKEQQLLKSLLDVQSNGFKNATSEIRNNQQAIQLLTKVYGEDSAVVRQLISTTAELTDQVGDMRAQIKAQASDTKVFDGLIGAAQGLVGIYSVAQGAAALFGDENEELQKTFVKLQAVMAILQGLQGIQNLLQKESAARQLVNIGNIIVRYAAIVAQKALNAAMSLAGGPLLAIIGLLALVVISLSSFSTASTKAARDFEKLNEEFKGFEALLNEEVDAIKRAGEETVAELESQFADEKTIRDARRKSLKEESAAIRRFLADNGAAYAEAFSDFEKLTNRQRAGEKLSEEEEKRLQQVGTFVEQFRAARERDFALDSQLELDRLNNSKATTEETIKARQDELETLRTQLQTRASVLSDAVSNEKNSIEERQAALLELQKFQTRILQNDTKKQLLAPGLTPSQRKLIVAQAKAAQDEINRNTQKQDDAFNEEKKQRTEKAQYDIARIAIETQAAADQEIMANENRSLEDRLFAAYEYYKAQEALITGQKNMELQNVALREEERKAIEDKANADSLAAKVAFNKQVQDITLQNLDIEAQRRLSQSNKRRDEELKALDDQYNDGKIRLQKYEQERLNIERKFSQESLQVQLENIDKLIDEYKEQKRDVTELEAARANIEKQISDDVTSKKIANVKKLREVEKQLAQETLDAVVSIVNSGYERELQQVEEQREALERKSEREIALTNAEAISKEEKEKKIALIEARTQAQREALERRQRAIELQRARFEKAVTIGRIIADTAAAVVAALGAKPYTPANIALAAVTGAIGAVQLAKAIATPLPKFAEGTDDAPGGLAWVGDAYRKELVVTPEGRLIETPAVPTVMNVPKHSIVMPDAEQAIRAMNAHLAQGTVPLPVDNGRYYREMTATLSGDIKRLEKTIKNKREVHIRRTRDGWEKITKSGGNETNYLNRNLQG